MNDHCLKFLAKVFFPNFDGDFVDASGRRRRWERRQSMKTTNYCWSSDAWVVEQWRHFSCPLFVQFLSTFFKRGFGRGFRGQDSSIAENRKHGANCQVSPPTHTSSRRTPTPHRRRPHITSDRQLPVLPRVHLAIPPFFVPLAPFRAPPPAAPPFPSRHPIPPIHLRTVHDDDGSGTTTIH